MRNQADGEWKDGDGVESRVKRTLRSRWMRWALRRRAGFHCPKCGEPLTRAFHADHVKAHVNGGKTNLYEMQALCPTCNLKKGDRDE